VQPNVKSRVRPGEVGSLQVGGDDDRDYGGWAKYRWHQMDVQRFPREMREFRDIGRLIREYIVPGHAPERPMLEAGDKVVTLGSCFARELRNYLDRLGFSSETFWIPSGLHNSFALLDFISWIVTGEETERGFRYDRFEGGEIREWTPEDERVAYAARLAEAGAFVLTYSIAEVWEDRETGGVFWRGVPEEIFDADRHVFRLSTVDENVATILRTIGLLRELNPEAPIVLTLSPGSIAGSFRGISCMTADCVSKSVLRVALDQVIERQLPGVYYWPGFELVRWAGAHLPWEAYGLPDGRPAHASRYLVAELMEAFVEAFYTPAAVAELHARRSWRPEPLPRSIRGRGQQLRIRARRRGQEVLSSLLASPPLNSPPGKALRASVRALRH
jgi:GSCFA family